MIKITGKHTEATVMTHNLEESCRDQIQEMVDNPTFGNHIVVMPDAHGGMAAVIGFTSPVTKEIIPNIVGVDIGCGVIATEIWPDQTGNLDYPEIDRVIRRHVPLGMSVHNRQIDSLSECFNFSAASEQANQLIDYYCYHFDWHFDHVELNLAYIEELFKRAVVDFTRAECAIGTLGGGNHFIEIGQSVEDEEKMYLTVHSGSRGPGKKVADYFQKIAMEQPHSAQFHRDFAYLTGDEAIQYLIAMTVMQKFAMINRDAIVELICTTCGFETGCSIESVHNYINPADGIVRKGAISSYKDELMLIPFNMKDGMLICEGTSNKEWNCSAPHGAGRIMGRNQAKKALDLTAFQQQMCGVYSTCINFETLDEAPGAYKPWQEIAEAITPTAKVVDRVMPKYNLKASEGR